MRPIATVHQPPPPARVRPLRLRPSAHRAAGFTLVEMLVVMAVIGAVALISIPNLILTIQRGKVVSTTREFAISLQRARSEGIRRGSEVVVFPDIANRQLVAFANVDDDPAFSYDPDTTATPRTVDYELLRIDLPQGVDFWGQEDAAPNDVNIVRGLSTDGGGDPVAVFQQDGSILAEGAFRVADQRGNFFEVQIAPSATARIQVLKYHRAPGFGDPGYYPGGRAETTNEPLWQWY